jgi:recombinational DNA repair ATPase RecF
MRLHYLKIDHFKNLNGFEIDLDEECQEPVTVLLGRNGSGKSNLFEALIIIFRDLINGKTTVDFAYDLRYTLRSGSVRVRVSNPSASTSDANSSPGHKSFILGAKPQIRRSPLS